MSNLVSIGSVRQPWYFGYGVALLAVSAGILYAAFFNVTNAVGPFVVAVIVTTWFGGTRPGLLVSAFSLLVLAYLFLSDPSLAMSAGQMSRLLYFVATAAFVVWVIASERKAVASLRRSQAELRLVIDTIPTMAWILQPNGKLEFLNRRWLDYSGLTLKQGLEGSAGTIHPEDSPRVLGTWQRMMECGQAYEGEMRLRRADGLYRWFLVRTVPLFDESGRLVRWYGTSTDIEDRKRAEQTAQQLSRRLLQVQEEERRHLSRELHDEFGQVLATIKLHLHAARSKAGEPAHASLEHSMALLQQAGEQVRSLALELRPALLETAGLDATLRWLAGQHQQRTGILTEVVGRGGEVAAEVAVACFRVAQEALTNVVQHARARRAWIELAQDDGALELVVRDDGEGFEVARKLEQARARGHLGLLGMRERVQILGGQLQIESQPGCGTRIRASIPMPRNLQ